MPRWSKSDRSPLGNLRAEAGLSRETVASALKLSLSTMVRYETGITDIPIGVAEDMAVLYHTHFDKLREAIKATKEAKGLPITGTRSKVIPNTEGI